MNFKWCDVSPWKPRLWISCRAYFTLDIPNFCLSPSNLLKAPLNHKIFNILIKIKNWKFFEKLYFRGVQFCILYLLEIQRSRKNREYHKQLHWAHIKRNQVQWYEIFLFQNMPPINAFIKVEFFKFGWDIWHKSKILNPETGAWISLLL